MLKRQLGMSLVELMVGLLMGAIAVAAVSAIYQLTTSNTRRQLESIHLHATVQQILSLIEADARRSGYWHMRWGLDTPANNPFQLDATDLRIGAYPGEPPDSCVLIAYDLDNDGKVGVGECPSAHCPDWSDTDNVEQFGFRLKDGAIQMRYGGTSFSCDTGRWQALTESAVDVGRLHFDLATECLSLDRATASCGPSGRQLLTRKLTTTLQAVWKTRPELRVASTRTIAVRNDRVVNQEDP